MRNKYLFEYRTKDDFYIQEAAYWPENDFEAVYNAMNLLLERKDLTSIIIYKQSGIYWLDAANVTDKGIIPLKGRHIVTYYKGDYEYLNINR